MVESAFRWGSRTARIVYACHVDALIRESEAGDLVINWDALAAEAEAQAALYGAPAPFAAGYIDGALCMADGSSVVAGRSEVQA